MIKFLDGDKPTICGRVTWGLQSGYITKITDRTYRVRWLDGYETEQLRPDIDEENIEYQQAATE
jgi:hypothetical protein